MTNGPVREAGETARSAIDVFRSQPYLLLSTVLNLALIGFVWVY